MSKRREKRISVAMPLLIDACMGAANPLPKNAVTLDVTSRGARVQLQSDWEVGELIWVERHSKRAQFRVVWVENQGIAKQQQIGIECVESEFDWGVPLIVEDDILAATSQHLELRTSNQPPHSRQRPKRSAPGLEGHSKART